MKNQTTRFIILFLFFLISFTAQSQFQLKTWYLANKQIDMTQSVPTISAIPGSTVSAINLGTGMYRSDNVSSQPQFYISDGNVYNGFNNPIGFLSAFNSSQSSPEIAIIPFDGNDGCNQDKYYVVYQSQFVTSANLRVDVVDMLADQCQGQVYLLQILATINGSIDGAGIAVGKEVGGQRNIYFSGSNIIYKVILSERLSAS